MELSKSRWYTKLELHDIYNLLRIAPGDQWKTAFWAREGVFELLGMPFGLWNTQASLQTFFNDTLEAFFDRVVTANVDDILIFSDPLYERQVHVSSILDALSGTELHLKSEKCEFHKEEVRNLGLIIGRVGV